MSTAAEASGAPVAIHGFILYPIGIPQYGRFENWMKQQAVDQGRDSIRGQGLSQQEMDTVMGMAYDSRKDLTFGSPVGSRHLNSIEGMTYLIWLSCQKGDRDLDLLDIELLLEDVLGIETIQEIVNTVLRISNLAKKPDGSLSKKKGMRTKPKRKREKR